jgi:hypothetical protein
MLDSYLSAGAACANNFGILKADDNGVSTVVNNFVPQVLQSINPLAGVPVKTQDGLISGLPQTVTFVGLPTVASIFGNTNSPSNNLFSTTNGSWASLNGSTGPVAADNRVLIAQITTNGCFSFKLNIQIGTPSGGVQSYVANSPVGSEIVLPSLTYTTTPAAPSVSISAAPSSSITAGTNVTFTATPTNGGVSPSYQWKKNGVNVGTNSNTFASSALANGDQITCVMTANGGCVSTTPVTSNTITMSVTAGGNSTLNINLFIQGFYTGSGTMTSVLFTDGLSTDPLDVDTVLVELHDALSTGTISASQSGILKQNGTLQVTFPSSVIGNSYYIVVKHRNTIETWSKNPVTFSANTTYNFTN